MEQVAYQRGIRQLFRITAGNRPGTRLDQFLSDEINALSRTEARKIIDLGGVHINGRRVRTCSTNISAGGLVEIYTDGLPLEIFRLGEEHILYRDKFLIVINKPAGIETQPTHSRYKGTLYDALLVMLGAASGQKKVELGMVQRLDRGTSGAMVFSIHQHSHKGLSQIFLEHKVDKQYLALVEKAPEPSFGEIRSMLARSHKYNRTVSVEHGGKDAVTRYQTRQAAEKGALLEVELLTGRSHQIRAHMSEAGSALLGDSLYGGAMSCAGIPLSRPLLHSCRLAFTHPISGEKLVFEPPVPADMQRICSELFEGIS
ncbi:RluA family pseudouridine synthase [Geopsychrobacter electrodiphilus]|uniref:RluA family pseudouridine synthase n=1 Tax=Geopsychrobacter electrodiphilus TaxID=225196 RepID=UPI00035F85E5|nr:RluA family pseudouridine synthase [Geopsychrobacter electrodiphilus]